MSCKQAIGVAEKMKEKFGDNLNVQMFTTDSMEAMSYKIRASTAVFVNEQQVSNEIALSESKMAEHLQGLI